MLELTFLGTSGAIPTAARSLPATLVTHHTGQYLVDCGEGTQMRLLQAGQSLRIHHIFLTHDHLDHVLGLGGLLLTLSLQQMKPRPRVTVYGGNTTLERAQLLASMIRSSADAQTTVEIHYVEVSAGVVLETNALRITAFRTNHRKQPCFGYVFETRGRSGVKVVFTGDTGYMPELAKIAHQADCLIAEANFAPGEETHAETVGHLTALQAAQIAADAEAKYLLLNHVSTRNADVLTATLANVETLFPNALLPNDLDRFRISKQGLFCLSE